MIRNAVVALSFAVVAIPLAASALLDTMPIPVGDAVILNKGPALVVRQPAACERACSQSNAGNCRAGDVTGNPGGDPQCAAAVIGSIEYTKLSSFGSAGSCVDRNDNNQCASGSCTTYQGKPVYGVAHRTFPFGTQMEVCNLKNDVCQIATVVERGPNVSVTSVTVDARAELAQALLIPCNTTADASYRVLSVPGVAKTAQPSGPASEALKNLLAASRITGNLGNGATNPTSYTPINTPFGTGYLGKPTNLGSPYASASPAPISSGSGGSASSGVIPVSQQLGSPYSAVTGGASSNPALSLQGALQSPQAQSTVQVFISGAPEVGSLIIQPQVVSHAGAFVVSWTSLNMKPGSCRVILDGNTVAAGENGSKSISAAAVPTGTLSFTLSCSRQDGSAFATPASVTIQ